MNQFCALCDRPHKAESSWVLNSSFEKKFPVVCTTWWFIHDLTEARNLSLSWASWIHSLSLLPMSLRSILILSLDLRNCLWPIYIYIYIYIYIHIHTYVCVFVCVCVYLSSLSRYCYMSCPSDRANYILVCGANQETPHCAAFSIFLALSLLSYQNISLKTLFGKKKP